MTVPDLIADARRAHPRVLVVDDQPLNIRAIHEALRGECEVLMATGGVAALALCRRDQPDLVLLDVLMPDLDGHEVCRRLKADPLTADIPVIFITGQQGAEEEVEGLALGAVDFISKPINPVVLRARVRTHLLLKFQTDRLRSLVMLDGLTGVANRRRFDEALATAWRQAQRDATPCALLMLDVDFFKRFNDRYGHQAGDDCLRAVAAALQQALTRPLDLAARYGGEEFVCLLPATAADGMRKVGERLLQAVRALAIEHADSSAADVVTISVGGAVAYPAQGGDAAQLVEAADAALYRAKQGGRARVCLDVEVEAQPA